MEEYLVILRRAYFLLNHILASQVMEVWREMCWALAVNKIRRRSIIHYIQLAEITQRPK